MRAKLRGYHRGDRGDGARSNGAGQLEAKLMVYLERSSKVYSAGSVCRFRSRQLMAARTRKTASTIKKADTKPPGGK
jgi:hypothetical protein